MRVCIDVDEQGKVSVGQEPEEGGDQASTAGGTPGAQPVQAQAAALLGGGGESASLAGGGESAEQSYMRPVPSIDAALQVAKQLLTAGQGDQAQGADAQMQQGFGKPQATTQVAQGGV